MEDETNDYTISIGDLTFSNVDNSITDFSLNSNTTDTIDISWIYSNTNLDINEVERMCKEYPALEKTWRNFKSVYDMVKQDYKGKVKAGDIEDEYPF